MRLSGVAKQGYAVLYGKSQIEMEQAFMSAKKKTLFNVVGNDPDPDIKYTCRRMLVGPWRNQPEQYEGYNGFVGWASIAVLKSGRWIITFNSGYWHASFPTVGEALKEERNKKWMEDYRAMGCPRFHAPRGGRCHLIYSDDAGLTWSKPATIVDTDNTNLHPGILEMNDGTLLCTFVDERLPKGDESLDLYYRIGYMLSKDQGQTWSEIKFLPETTSMGNEPPIQIAGGTILRITSHRFDSSKEYDSLAIFASVDNGQTFEILSTIQSDDHHMHEPTMVEMNDGRLAIMTRPDGDICFSDDKGKTWTKPVRTGIHMYDPHLVQLPNGVLAVFHGSWLLSYFKKGLAVCLSKDNGQTWNGPGEDLGYEVDSSAFGYSCPVVLDDGTVYVVYQHTGGHKTHHARTQALWGIRVRIPESADGIEILPAPGSPEDFGYSEAFMAMAADHDFGKRDTRTVVDEAEERAGDNVFNRLWNDYDLLEDVPKKGWKIKKDLDDIGDKQGWAEPEFDDSEWYDIEIGDWWDNFDFHATGLAWYRGEWTVTDEAAGRRKLLLAFGAVDGENSIYIDGKNITPVPRSAEYWKQPFELDVTEYLQPGKKHTLAIKIKNECGPSGIWKSVKLITPK